MPHITANITVSKTVSTLDAEAIAAILAWVKANITDKLPSDATATAVYSVVP